MADLIQIQYEVVDKGKSLKTALTGVERMEKSLAKLSKEITSGTVTQDRQRKALIAYGRELKRLTGLTGTQAYGAVVKYKNALVNQTVAQNKAAIASQRLAKVQDYLATRQERVTLATQQQNAALHQTKNKMNGSNMAVQQLGYQFGDFAVQVQGGTSAFVAFSQQASQLVGILPMVAGPLGLSMGAAVGLSAALGILIPIGSAVGRMFMEMNTSANEAAAKIKKFEDNLKSAKAETVDMTEALRLLRSGFETEGELALNDALVKARDHLREMLEAQKNINAAAFESESNKAVAQSIAKEAVDKAQEALDLAREDARVHREAAAALEKEKDRQKRDESVINQLAEAREILRQQGIKQEKEAVKESKKRAKAIYDAVLDHKKLNASAQQELDLLKQKNVLLDLELQYGKDSSVYKEMAIGYEEENLRAKLEAKGVDEIIIAAQIKALLIQKGITGELVDQLALKKLQAQFEQKPRGGRGGDPRKQGGSFIDRNTIEATKFLKDYEKNLRKTTKATEEADKAAEALRKELEAPMVKAIDSVSNAFGDFIADGLKDFKSFAKSIVGSFKSMISQMIATAARNKIMLSLGMGGSGFAASAAAGNVAGVGGNAAFGPIGSFMGSFAGGGAAGTGLLGGLGTGLSAFGGGVGAGFGASFGSLGTLLSGGSTVAAGGAGFAATLGAAIPAIAAVAVVVGLLSKKTKLLDSGLRTTIEGFDVAIETFQTTQSSRLFGLLKSRAKTGYEAASAEVADPLIEAIGNMQQSIVDAAGTLGIGANAFDDFSYQFKLSLKGLTEEEQLQKINEEINKMGDSFASLTGHFETMNELLEAANQRMQLQNRLDQLLGNNQAILTRQREAELLAMHELNRPLAQMVYNLEDAQASVQSAFASLGASIEAEKNRLRDAFASIVDGLKGRLDVANETMARSNNIYSMLESAVSGRSITSGIGQSLSRREGALGFIREGDFSDEKELEKALSVVAEPSEDLFSSFVDYARDFSRTNETLEEAKEVAKVQLTADEKSVLLLEEQIAQSQVDLDAQLEALDKQYQMEVDQYNALLGIDTSVKSVTEAIGTLKGAIEALAAARAAATGGGGGGGGGGAAAAGIKFTGEKYQGYDLGNIRGAADLMAAAAQNNIQTSGQTGAQIQQAISNATGLAINMDNATRGKQFAMGGYHTGGLRMVGERGPELEATGPSRIFSHNQTSGMFKDPDLKEAVNELRREVSGLRSEQRQMSASNAKYVKRNYDINRKWDVDGLPATRT